MGAAGVLLMINGLIDVSTKLITWYQSLPDSDEEIKKELEKMKTELDTTKTKVAAVKILDVP